MQFLEEEVFERAQNAMRQDERLESRRYNCDASREERCSGRYGQGPLHVVVRGVTTGDDERMRGHRFSMVATAHDASVTGLSLVVGHPFAVGARLFVVFSLAGNWSRIGKPLPRIAALAVVRHVRALSGTDYAVDIELTRHRLLNSGSSFAVAPSPLTVRISAPRRHGPAGSVLAGLAAGRPSLLR